VTNKLSVIELTDEERNLFSILRRVVAEKKLKSSVRVAGQLLIICFCLDQLDSCNLFLLLSFDVHVNGMSCSNPIWSGAVKCEMFDL
jgi:hypothetical protein